MHSIQQARDLYLGGNFHEALKVAQAVCEQHPKDADAWWLLGCVSRHTGMPQASDDAFRRATALCSNRKPPLRVDKNRFRELLEEARSELPTTVRSQLESMAIRIAPMPDEEAVKAGLHPDASSCRMEDSLTIYQVNLENQSPTEDALRNLLAGILRSVTKDPYINWKSR
jgi:hypothetical protein